MALCTVAVVAAGCANHDDLNTSPTGATLRVTAPDAQVCTVDIGDRIWFDVNCNGIQDKDETGGPEGIKVTLINCANTDEKYHTATGPDGSYLFDDVPAGTYQICIEVPGGYAATLEDVGDNDGIDSDINSEGCTGCREYECDKPDLTRDVGLCEKKGEEDFEGCTPGFWRNHLSHWDATPYSPGDLVNDTFGCDLVSDDALTLGEVIDAPQTYGALAFHAIAALLNSTHPDVDFGLDRTRSRPRAGDKGTLPAKKKAARSRQHHGWSGGPKIRRSPHGTICLFERAPGRCRALFFV
jgi:hypothetical protein